MAVIYFVWLGSGRAKRHRVDPEGQLLDQAAKAGLPVAPGAILLDQFFRVCLEKGLVEMLDGRVIIPDAELLHATLFHSVRLPRFKRPIAVCPIPAGIDEARAPDESRHGFIIHADRPDELARMLATAWNAAVHRSDDARRDVLLLEEIAAEHSGRAFIGNGEQEDRIERYNNDIDGMNFTLPVLTGWKKPGQDQLPYARRLQMLLRGVRRTFGHGEWVVEWVDDGQICRLHRIMPPELP